jgi:NAD+ kinase
MDTGMNVGVVPPEAPLVDEVAAAGAHPVTGPDATDPDAVEAVAAAGPAALRSLAPCTLPVLAVDCPDLPGVARADLDRGLRAAAEAGATTRVPVIAARTGDTEARAVYDVTLVTAEPARISEYAVTAGGERLDEFRADGVVVATPAGSRGYARDAGGPTVLAADVASVVPVGPFQVHADAWVVGLDGPADPAVVVTVERDEASVDLHADGERVSGVRPGDPVAVGAVGHLHLVERHLERL